MPLGWKMLSRMSTNRASVPRELSAAQLRRVGPGTRCLRARIRSGVEPVTERSFENATIPEGRDIDFDGRGVLGLDDGGGKRSGTRRRARLDH